MTLNYGSKRVTVVRLIWTEDSHPFCHTDDHDTLSERGAFLMSLWGHLGLKAADQYG